MVSAVFRCFQVCIKSLPFEAPRAVAVAFATSRVDRCNSLLVGAPKRLNAAAKAAVQSEQIRPR